LIPKYGAKLEALTNNPVSPNHAQAIKNALNTYPRPPTNHGNKRRPYNFKYKVENPDKSGHFQHEEVSNGDETQGRYDIARPGFESRTIYSVAKGSGFNAETSYSISG